MTHKMISEVLKETYHTKVYKLSLSSGCSCPNRDGALGMGGCSFCSEGGSGDFASPPLPIHQQIALARQKVDAKIPAKIPLSERKYIAYFQSFTNTYGDPERLEGLYTEAIRHPQVVALSIGTRPDCISGEMLEALQRLNQIKPVWVELGLQTIHEKTANWFHRGYPLAVFEETYRRLKAAGLTVIVHVILGFPTESQKEMLESVSYLGKLEPGLDGIKLQLLHVLKGTELGRKYEKRPFPVMELEEYCRLVADCVRLLPTDIVLHRVTGDGPRRLLLAPKWSTDKKRVLNTIRAYLEKTETREQDSKESLPP